MEGHRWLPGVSALGLVALTLLHVSFCSAADASEKADSSTIFVTARMPDYKVDHRDAYLCTAVPLPERPLKLVGIEPLAKQEIAHHMLLFGCEYPASKDPVWDCHMQSVCGSGPESSISHGEHVLYGWGKDAPAMHLPDGAGFSVGPGTGIRMAVLQVHFQVVRPEGDHTGVRLELTSAPQPNSAGMFMYASGFTVPPKDPAYHVPASCCYAGWEPVRAFAFRVHAHALGRRIWMERDSPTGGEAEQIVSQDPQLPQGFYPVTSPTRFLPGDDLTVTCEYNSMARTTPTSAGSTAKDEMCNMYMMTYSELPVFMTCGNGNAWYQVDGPGGIPPATRLAPESSAAWRPPAPIGVAANDEPTMGQVSGVALGVDGDTLWVLHRGARVWDGATYAPDGEHLSEALVAEGHIPAPVVLQLDKETGAVLQSWGAGLLHMPHSIISGRDGNVWVTDVGLHQVLKFSPDGKQLLALGEALTPGADQKHFCKPTGVALSRSGDIFVSDGYCNSRVVQFTAAGVYIREYAPPEKTAMNIPHSVVLDDCAGAVYVADRENARVMLFYIGDDKDAQRELSDLKEYGAVYAITAGPYGTLLALCWDQGADKMWVLELAARDDGEVMNKWQLEGVASPHDLAISAAPLRITGSGERVLAFYVAETRPQGSRLQKFILLHGDLKVVPPEAPVPAPAGASAQKDAQPAADSSAEQQQQQQEKEQQKEQQQQQESSSDASNTTEAGVSTPAKAVEKSVPQAEQGGGHAAVDQDLSQPPRYERQDSMSLQDAVVKMLMIGVPFAAAFVLVAFILWRKMQRSGHQFQPVFGHEI